MMTSQELREKVRSYAKDKEPRELRWALQYLCELAIYAQFPDEDHCDRDSTGLILLDRPCYAWNSLRGMYTPTRTEAEVLFQKDFGIVVDTSIRPCNRKKS